MAAVAERFEGLAAAFRGLAQDIAPAHRAERERAFDRFLGRGFPTTRDEEWRFTNVGPVAETPWVRAHEASPDRATIAPYLLAGMGAQIVLVNGRFSPTLSDLRSLPPGVTIERRQGERGLVHVAEPDSAFADLNAAFHEDTLTIEVARKAIVTEPLHVLSIAVGDAAPQLIAPRLGIHVGEAAQVSIVETHAGVGGGVTLSTVVTHLQLEPHAIVEHVKIQREADTAFHLASMAFRLDRASTLRSTALTFGARIARHDITATLDGEGAECTLNGLYVVTGTSLADTHTTIDHAKPHCPSHELYKGILGGKARAVFNGKIIVRPQAQKTDAKQTNKALLLTGDAQVNTKPQLEIFADDVKCTHGAAIGQLDEDALFYLRARGIGQDEARAILVHAFAGAVIDGIDLASVREQALALLDAKLAIAHAS
jgi:Fe-S cluster assembly protein SufD